MLVIFVLDGKKKKTSFFKRKIFDPWTDNNKVCFVSVQHLHVQACDDEYVLV